jgi:hypothetical protein
MTDRTKLNIKKDRDGSFSIYEGDKPVFGPVGDEESAKEALVELDKDLRTLEWEESDKFKAHLSVREIRIASMDMGNTVFFLTSPYAKGTIGYRFGEDPSILGQFVVINSERRSVIRRYTDRISMKLYRSYNIPNWAQLELFDSVNPTIKPIMTLKEFLSTCAACGGDWGSMVMSGIKKTFPERYAMMDNDHEYSFAELMVILQEEGINTQ